MYTTWQSIAWKEWHEHKWKLCSTLVILWTLLVYTALSTRSELDVLQLVMALVVCCIIPLSIFIAIGDAAGEQSRRTLPFFQSLPVSMRQAAAAKLVFGLAALVIPLLSTCLLVYGWSFVSESFAAMLERSFEQARRHPSRIGIGNPVVDYTLAAAVVAASVYLWSATVSVNRKDEVSAAAMAMGVVVGTWVILMYVASTSSFAVSGSLVGRIAWMLLAAAPGAILGLDQVSRMGEHAILLYFAIALAAHAALAAVYIRRFGQVAEREIASPRGEMAKNLADVTILPPRRSPFAAAIWKQTRESGPLALVGLAIAAGATVVIALADPSSSTNRREEINLLFAATSLYVGTLLAMVIGIGAFLHDTEPGLMSFWRSRPIGAGLWFWTKVGSALCILMTSVYVPALLALWLSGRAVEQFQFDASVLIIPAGQLALFAAAASMTCLVRHAVYAATLSIPATFAGPLVMTVGLFLVTRFGPGVQGMPSDWWQRESLAFAIYMVGLLLSFGGNLLLAWLAIKYDWGRKTRY